MAFEGLELPEFFELDVDSLVDDSLINTSTLFDEDINFSVVQMQKTEEKSPFHESDSGVSDMGGNGSPLWEKDIPMLDEMLEDSVGPFLLGCAESDDEYISQHRELLYNVKSSEQYHEEPEGVIDSQTSIRKTRFQSTAFGKQREPQSSVQSSSHHTVRDSRSIKGSTENSAASMSGSNTSTSEMNTVHERTRRKPRGLIQVKRAGEKLPSTNSDKCSVTSVKVLRVVKSTDDSNTEDDIAKALDERNRKNAEMARQNRLKKKAYVGNLESEVEDSRKKIDELETALNDVEEERDFYKKEVEYLKSVLANQSALAGLLKNIPSVSGVTLSSSMSRKRVAELDHSYTPMKKSRQEELSTHSGSGVCLHVDSDKVSLEFCHHCADMAKGGAFL